MKNFILFTLLVGISCACGADIKSLDLNTKDFLTERPLRDNISTSNNQGIDEETGEIKKHLLVPRCFIAGFRWAPIRLCHAETVLATLEAGFAIPCTHLYLFQCDTETGALRHVRTLVAKKYRDKSYIAGKGLIQEQGSPYWNGTLYKSSLESECKKYQEHPVHKQNAAARRRLRTLELMVEASGLFDDEGSNTSTYSGCTVS